jgi:hypothetical protein
MFEGIIAFILALVFQLPHAITEDDPRWDCRYMGNRICGP